MVSSPTRERCLLSNHAAGLQVDNYVATPSASIEAQPPLNGGGRLSRSPTAATAAAGPRRRPRGCCSSSQRLPLATRGVRTRVWGRVVHRLDAGRAQRPLVGAARASEAVALWAFRGAPIASRNSPTLTLGHRRYAREYFSDLFCMTWNGLKVLSRAALFRSPGYVAGLRRKRFRSARRRRANFDVRPIVEAGRT